MQKLAEICIRRPVFAAMIILALVVVGAAAYFRLGRRPLPVGRPADRQRPHDLARARRPRRSRRSITQLIEEVVNTVDGIDELRSISGPGTSIVIATFNLDRDIETAAQDVRDRVATVISRLPEDARRRRSFRSSTTTARRS